MSMDRRCPAFCVAWVSVVLLAAGCAHAPASAPSLPATPPPSLSPPPVVGVNVRRTVATDSILQPALTPATVLNLPAKSPSNLISAQIVATRVTGTVTIKREPRNPPARLANNDTVPQDATVNTGPNSSVVLVFSNGTVVQLGAESELAIAQFLQDPYPATIKLAALVKEPTVSRTKLVLNRGELVGVVKNLNQEQGSSFAVATPAGIAENTGGFFRLVFRPAADLRSFLFSVSAVGCEVYFGPPSGSGAINPGAKTRRTVPAGQVMTITVTSDGPQPGQPGPEIITSPIPPAVLEEMMTIQGELIMGLGSMRS